MRKVVIFVIALIILLVTVFVILNLYSNKNLENNIQNTNEDNNQNIVISEIENNEDKIEQVNNDLEKGSDSVYNNEKIKINLIVNNHVFSATLENNETVKELILQFPMTLTMNDLNSNEKYNYLEHNLTTNSTKASRINAGDIKLYGNNCLVIFYKSFNTSYSYTNLGVVDNIDEFISSISSGNVNITFELAN